MPSSVHILFKGGVCVKMKEFCVFVVKDALVLVFSGMIAADHHCLSTQIG